MPRSSSDEKDFVSNLALGLFAVSLGFSIQFSNTTWGFSVRMCVDPPPFSPTVPCGLSLLFMGLNGVSLVILCFLWYRGWFYGRLRKGEGFCGFFGLSAVAVIVGIAPWIVFAVTFWFAQVLGLLVHKN